MFSEEALSKFPILRKSAFVFHNRVYPVDSTTDVLVFDSVSCGGVVFHHLACATATVDVNLEEDDVASFGDSKPVFLNQPCSCVCAENGCEKACKVALIVRVD